MRRSYISKVEARVYGQLVDKKLETAEQEALKVLRRHNLTASQHAHGYELDMLNQEIDALKITAREKRKIDAARNVLFDVAAVREARAQETWTPEFEAALDAMSRVERTPELLDNAYRGAKNLAGAAKGGSGDRDYQLLRRDGIRQIASDVRKRHPDWSDSDVARQIPKEDGYADLTPDGKKPLTHGTIRKMIASS